MTAPAKTRTRRGDPGDRATRRPAPAPRDRSPKRRTSTAGLGQAKTATVLTPRQKTAVRRAITDFCTRAEVARLKWYYSQHRPFTGFGVAPELPHSDDCSAYVSLAFNWAMHKTGIYLPDPLNEHYSGEGYTGTQLDYLRVHPAPANAYLVGDMPIFGTPSDTVHTSICREAGTAATAIFSSNGHQSWIFNQDAPEPISLTHEKAIEALVGVYRHPALL